MPKVTLSYLKGAILPALGQLRVGAVVRTDIARFFHGYGRRKPGGANRSHDILRTMFDYAIAWGHRPEAAGNPCTGIVRYRRHPRVGCSARTIWQGSPRCGANAKTKNPVCVAMVRLLLLTGRRSEEIRDLRWCEVKPDKLALTDAKTGPRRVLLCEAARELPNGLAAPMSGEWVFPGGKGSGPLSRIVLWMFGSGCATRLE